MSKRLPAGLTDDLAAAIFERLKKYANRPITPQMRRAVAAEVMDEIHRRIPDVETFDVFVDPDPCEPGMLRITTTPRSS